MSIALPHVLLFVMVTIWWLGIVEGQIPSYFIARVNTTHPRRPYYTLTEYHVDAVKGIRTNTLFVYPNDERYEIAIYPAEDFSQYLVFPRIFGVHVEPPLCFWNELNFDDLPFVDAAFSILASNGTVFNETADIFYGEEYWWYSKNTTLGTYFPLAWANIDGLINVVTDFSLEIPSTRTFEPPRCYPVNGPVLHKRHLPINAEFPGSFKMTIGHEGYNRTISVDSTLGWSGARTDVAPMHEIPQFSEFRFYNGDGKLYTWINWFDINPSPCVWELHLDPQIWVAPELSHIGTVRTTFNSSPLDMFGAGPDLNEVWFFDNTSTPVGYLPFDRRNPGGPAPITEFMAGTPPSTDFTVPKICFPRYNGTTYSKRSISAIPQLPPAFTMYISSVHANLHQTSRTIYYDTSAGKLRIDENGSSYVQVGTDLYIYARQSQAALDPVPCAHFTDQPPVWTPPKFFRQFGNATISGQMTGVYASKEDPLDTYDSRLQYWYITPAGVPLYYMHSAFSANRVFYFSPVTPPSGVFDVPTSCHKI